MEMSRLLIVGITPYFLDRGNLWFEENLKQILEARRTQSFFQDYTIYIEKNKESLPADQTEEQLRKTVAENLRQQMLNEKVQKWLADLQAKAKVQYFVQY